MIKFGFRNQVYNPQIPLYIKIGQGMVVNRLSGKEVEVQSLLDAMTAEGYSAPAGEIGISAAWEQDNLGWWTYDGVTPQQPPVQTPVATGATAGKPGAFVPPGALPANLQALIALSIGTGPAWTAGQNVILGDTNTAYWDGTTWKAGVVPTPYAPPTVTPTQGIPADGDQAGAAVIDIDFHGNSIPVGGLTATITYDIGGGDVVTTQALTAGDSPSAASADITAKLNGVTEFTAGKVGNTITVTPGAGVTIAKLVLAIA